MSASVTKWVMLVAAVTLIVYDVVVLATGAHQATYSRVLLSWALDWFMVPFVFGIVVGHLFTARRRVQDRIFRLVALWAVLVLAALLDVFLENFKPAPAMALIAGCGFGMWLWPQLLPRKRIVVF